MKTRILFYVGLLIVAVCLCSSCSEESSIQLPEKQKNMTMEDVLQIYLDAGFEIDSTATPKGESFATPEEALAALKEWQEWKIENGLAVNSRATGSLHECKLHYGAIPKQNNRMLYYFFYRQFQVTFTTGSKGKVSFESLHGAFYGNPLPCIVINTQPMVFSGCLDANGPNISFLMHTEICAHFEIFGFRIKEDHILINSYCTTDLEHKKVHILDVSII